MSDWGKPATPVLPLFVSTFGIYSPALAHQTIAAATTQAAVQTWVANLISYTPMSIPFPYPVKRVWWVNGSTNTSTNVDFGIYTEDGTRIYNTGSTAMGTVSTVQYVTPTEFMLDAGRYFFAWSCSNTTNRGYVMTGPTAISGRLTGQYEETPGAFGLPAAMTPVAWTRAFGPSICGLTRTTTGF